VFRCYGLANWGPGEAWHRIALVQTGFESLMPIDVGDSVTQLLAGPRAARRFIHVPTLAIHAAFTLFCSDSDAYFRAVNSTCRGPNVKL
jgi:hypothetical protein